MPNLPRGVNPVRLLDVDLYEVAMVARLQALGHATERAAEVMPRVRVQTRSGRWLVLHAARLSSHAGRSQIAVILEPAAAAEVVPLILQAYGLTDREAHVTEPVFRGVPTNEIADALLIAALTVQQHLKAVFDKIGARS